MFVRTSFDISMLVFATIPPAVGDALNDTSSFAQLVGGPGNASGFVHSDY